MRLFERCLTLFIALTVASVRGEAVPQAFPSDWPSDLAAARVDELPSGLEIVYLPVVSAAESRASDWVDIAFGYSVGLRAQKGFDAGTSGMASAYLAMSVPARTVALVAHLTGGTFGFIDDPELVGMRLRIPRAALIPVVEQIVAYFRESEMDPEILDYSRRVAPESAARVEASAPPGVVEAVMGALLGEDASLRLAAASPDPGEIDTETIRRYFKDHFGTDRAYIVMSVPPPASVRRAFGAIEARISEYASPLEEASGTDAIDLQFPSRPQGAMIMATAVPSVHFDGWFEALLVDRLLRRGLDLPARFELGRSLEPSYHWLQVPVEVPGFPEDAAAAVERRLLSFATDSLEGLLARAKQDVFGYLADGETREWFAAHGLFETLRSGWRRVWNLDSEDLASIVQNFVARRRVTAMWSAAFAQPTVRVESLEGETAPEQPASRLEVVAQAPGRVRVPTLGRLQTDDLEPVRVERLASGVTLADSDMHALFIAGGIGRSLPGGRVEAEGTNGSLWVFDTFPGPDVLSLLGEVRPDRLLVFVPGVELPRARERFRNWRSGTLDSTSSLAAGEVATVDMPAILILKVWLEAKIIEAGWWGLVDVRIEGIEGARLVIDADSERAAQIDAWIETVAVEGIPEEEFLQVRHAAAGYFSRIRKEFQIILWQRAPDGEIQSPDTVTRQRLQTVANLYF